ncbi:uncharacterized protein FIBRA_02543 [Fibroporia radiculosa]|uniref:Uncharacterized protein n=1 Tax=Fibroporia radiculosa TaxID=599839 RepID=J4H1X0_9APHY|nr:uncharacterized protein FIBRA_02543 [Fibroporia radiculosa]CCM00509.1 predicted protein [Fibroporia radiculosa]
MRKKATERGSCLTIETDGKTRCPKEPADGDRCRTHQKQHRTMCKRYKEAAKIVDEMQTAGIPLLKQIASYDDLDVAKKKAKLMRQFVEAVRVERIGRETHHKRFFLKNIMDALEERVFDLQYAKDPAYSWVKDFQEQSSAEMESSEKLDSLLLAAILAKSDLTSKDARVTVSAEESEEDDPIELVMRAYGEKREYLKKYRFIRESREDFIERSLSKEDRRDQDYVRHVNIQRDIILQYTRRVLLHDPILVLKADKKVSFNDLFLDPNFTAEDFKRVERGQMKALMEGMIWWRDATLEALSLWPKNSKEQIRTTANVGKLGERFLVYHMLGADDSSQNPDDRFKLVGGWVFKTRHTRKITNEAWWVSDLTVFVSSMNC